MSANGDRRAISIEGASDAAACDRDRIDDAVHRERSRIAMELHDGLVQSLYGTGLALRAASRRDPSDRDPLALERAAEALDRMIDETRAYVAALEGRESVPPELGAGLDALADSAAAAGFDVEVEVSRDEPSPLPDATRREILRVAHEAVSNAVRHGRGRRLALSVHVTADVVTLSVEDDGVGFAPDQAHWGCGLRNMARRAEALGGRLHVTSEPGSGTLVLLVVERPAQALDDVAAGGADPRGAGEGR